MARLVANVDVTTETFGAWLVRTNTLLDALSYEIITANTTYANTGTTAAPRHAQLFGSLTANTLVATDSLCGGNTSSVANLNITSNTIVSNVTFVSAANSLHTNTQFFTANVQANGALLSIIGTSLNVTSNVVVTAANQQFNSNSTIAAISIVGNSTATNTTVGGTTLNVTANLSVTGVSHTIAGNVNIDTGSLFIDSVNNRIGVNTQTPDTNLNVIGSSNTSANAWVGNTLSVVGMSLLSGGVTSPTANLSVGLNVGANITANTTAIRVGNGTVSTTLTQSALSTNGSLAVTGTASLSNTLSVAGTLNLSSDIVIKTDYVKTVAANNNIGTNSSARVIYSFPKTSYRSGKMLVFANNNNGMGQVNQLAEMVLAHDGNTAYCTVYGVVGSPVDVANTLAPLGTFSAQINSSSNNVELLMTQVYSNTTVKVVAELIV